MADKKIRIINKNTGEEKVINASQYKVVDKGFTGIGQDIAKSLANAPQAAGESIVNLAKTGVGAGKYALTTNPVSTLANIGAGGVEGAAGLLSMPEMMARYLNEKFPDATKNMKAQAERYPDLLATAFAKQHPEIAKSVKPRSDNDATIYEGLMNWEQQHGLTPQNEGERNVRDLGQLIFGGKGLTKLSSPVSRIGAITAQAAGEGGDPIHAALVGTIGEVINKAFGKKQEAKSQQNAQPTASVSPDFNKPIIPGMNVTLGGFAAIPQAVKAFPDVVAALPEVAENVGSALKKGSANVAATGVEALGKGLAGMKIKGADTLGEMGADYIRFKSTSPEEYAVKKVLGDIKAKDLPKIEQSVNAARRLNFEYWTPAEAKNSIREASKQGGIGRTDEGMDRLQERGEARADSEARAVDDLFREIYDPSKLVSLKNEKYQSAMQSELPFEFIGRHRNRPTVVRAIEEIKSNPALRQLIEEEVGAKFDNINPNSFQYWDMVKQAMDELEENSKSNTGNPTTTSKVYADTRRQIVKQMDEINPDYKPARRIAERGFVRRKLEKYFDSRRKNALNMAKFLEKSSNKDYLLKKLSDLPIALQMIEDFETVGKSIIPTKKTTREARAKSETSMSDARNSPESRRRQMQQKYGEAHDVASVDLMTHPKWFEFLKEQLSKKGK